MISSIFTSLIDYMNISLADKHTLKIHLTYSIIEGIIKGILVLNEFIFIKSLLGSNYQLSFLFQFSVVVLSVSIVFNELLKRIVKKRKFIFYIGLLTRLPLLSLLFFPSNPEVYTSSSLYHYWFLGVFLVFFSSTPLIFPTINLLLKNAYSKNKFGKYYSYGQQAEKISILISAFAFGILLDYNAYSFTIAYPILALFGIFSVYYLTKIKYVPKPVEIAISYFKSVGNSFSKMVYILKTNKAFFHYQLSFLFYGFAFMSTVSVITIYFSEELLLNYSSIAFYKNVFNILAIFLFPFFGRRIDRVDPRKFIIFTFLSLGFYILFIMLSQKFNSNFNLWEFKIYPTLLIAIVFMGIFTASMSLSWNIGSSYFGTDEEAGDYQSIHLTLTGFRAMFSPILGILFLELFGYTITFSLALLSLLIAIGIMVYSLKKRP